MSLQIKLPDINVVFYPAGQVNSFQGIKSLYDQLNSSSFGVDSNYLLLLFENSGSTKIVSYSQMFEYDDKVGELAKWEAEKRLEERTIKKMHNQAFIEPQEVIVQHPSDEAGETNYVEMKHQVLIPHHRVEYLDRVAEGKLFERIDYEGILYSEFFQDEGKYNPDYRTVLVPIGDLNGPWPLDGLKDFREVLLPIEMKEKKDTYLKYAASQEYPGKFFQLPKEAGLDLAEIVGLSDLKEFRSKIDKKASEERYRLRP